MLLVNALVRTLGSFAIHTYMYLHVLCICLGKSWAADTGVDNQRVCDQLRIPPSGSISLFSAVLLHPVVLSVRQSLLETERQN